MQILTEDMLEASIDWPSLIAALRHGHTLPKALVNDTLLAQAGRKYLVRSAWIEGLGACTKAVTIYPDNPSQSPALPSVQGQVIMFDEASGTPIGLIDGPAETRLKTAADSALGSALLSREDSKTLLMVGAGNMAGPLIEAHLAARPALEKVLIWNRTIQRAASLATELQSWTGTAVDAVSDLDAALPAADIICSATMSEEPVIKGALLSEGTHLDLVGAFAPAMREADDVALTRARLFADSFDTTLDHIGEYKIPLKNNIIQRADVLADLYALVGGAEGRISDTDITLFKNGGGAHLDLMISHHLANR